MVAFCVAEDPNGRHSINLRRYAQFFCAYIPENAHKTDVPTSFCALQIVGVAVRKTPSSDARSSKMAILQCLNRFNKDRCGVACAARYQINRCLEKLLL